MPSGGGRCEEHYRKEAGLPPLHSASGKEIHSFTPAAPAAPPVVKIGAEARTAAAEEKGEPMNSKDGRASKLGAAGMQRDRDAGMRVAEIAKKYKCNPASVYNNTKSNGIVRPRKTLAEKAAAALSTDGRHANRGRPPAGGGTRGTRGRPRKQVHGGSFDDMIEQLRERRETLNKELAGVDRAIAALEEIP
jgi:hypothetical protein